MPDESACQPGEQCIAFGRHNPFCSNCHDERGGPFRHTTGQCRYEPTMRLGDVQRLPHLAQRQDEFLRDGLARWPWKRFTCGGIRLSHEAADA